MTLTKRHFDALNSAYSGLKKGTGERGQYHAFLGDGKGVGNICNPIPPTYREVWVRTGVQAGSTSTGGQLMSAPLSWLMTRLLPYVNDPQYEGMPVVVGYAVGSNRLEVLRPDGLGADSMLQNLAVNPLWYSRPHTLCQGRLSGGSGQPTVDASSIATIYWSPLQGGLVGLYNGYSWRVKPVSVLSLSLSGYANSTPYDIFMVDNGSSAPTLTGVAWTNALGRATALVYQDGIAVLSTHHNYRYLGTVFISPGSTTQDTVQHRYIYNYYNRVLRALRVYDSTASWAYTTASFRSADGNNNNFVDVMNGDPSQGYDPIPIYLEPHAIWGSTGTAITTYVSVGRDSITTPEYGGLIGGASNVTNNFNTSQALYSSIVPFGYHYYMWLEQGAAGVTFYGGQLGSSMGGFAVL